MDKNIRAVGGRNCRVRIEDSNIGMKILLDLDEDIASREINEETINQMKFQQSGVPLFRNMLPSSWPHALIGFSGLQNFLTSSLPQFKGFQGMRSVAF